MKNLIILLSVFFINVLYGQNINYLEYFFDADPGAGQGNPITITPASSIDIKYNVDISTLDNGFHTLFIRGKDELGNWTFVHQNHFFKDRIPVDPLLNIVRLEYFIDNDPGYGHAINVPITQDNAIEKSFNANLTELPLGMHILYIRVKDEIGNWSIIHQKPFSKERINIDLPNIVGIEYFFTKGEFTSGVNHISNFTPNDSVDVTFLADLSALSLDSTYNMHVYAIDENGSKSLAYMHEIAVVVTGVNELTTLTPKKFNLSQNYPNPFNPETRIKFSIPKLSNVSLTIYNALGQKVTDLFNREFKAGFYDVKWDASGFASGIYFYRLRSDNFVSVKKMFLLQ